MSDELAVALDRLDKIAATAVGQIERATRRVAAAARLGVIDYRAERTITEALATVLKVEQDRAKLLGLNTPQQAGPEQVDYEQEAKELQRMLGR